MPAIIQDTGNLATASTSSAEAAEVSQPLNELSQRELLDKVSLDFLDGPPLETKKEAPKKEETASKAETEEAPNPQDEETETVEGQELEDPGEDAADQAFAPEAQTGPKWLSELLDKLPEGALPEWGTKRLREIVEKGILKSKELGEKNTRVAELEEKLSELRATEPAATGEDIRGEFRRVEDPAQIQRSIDSADQWYQWAVNVKPDEFGNVPNPETRDGEDWTLAEVHQRLKLADNTRKAGKAQLAYLADYSKTNAEVRKQLPALFDLKSDERKIATTYLNKMPWLDAMGDKDSILARLVLGEQALQKRAKGVQTVDVSTAKPAPAAKATPSKAPVVPTAPMRKSGTDSDIGDLRTRAANGDQSALNALAKAFIDG